MGTLGPADNCGECVTEGAAVTVRPYRVIQATEGVRAYYHCPACGHRWWTGWALRKDAA